MTEEEKEAIKKLNEFAYTIHGGLSVGEAKIILSLINRQQEDFELLKEQEQYVIDEYEETIEKKDKIINEELKENVNLQKELNEENRKCMILANNNKFQEQIIDEMSKDLLVCGFDFIDIGKSNGSFKEDKEKLKQYYRRKVEV